MTNLEAGNPSEAGLPAERTSLAWTRTSFVVLAGLAAALALTTYLIGRRRQQTLSQHPLPKRITPSREVYLVGISVIVLILLIAFALPV